MRSEHLYVSEMLDAVDDVASFVEYQDLDSFLVDKQA